MSQWRFYRDYQLWSDSFRLFISHDSESPASRQRALVLPLALKVIEPGAPYDEPSLASEHFDVNGFLQAALDCAWECGLRPKDFADSASELKATRYHLEDMRALAKVPPR